MRIKRLLMLVVVGLLSLVLIGCGEKKIEIGILQYADVLALDEARQGFIDGLKDAGYEKGKNINITVLNPHGSFSETESMAKVLLRKSDLILAIATPAASAVVTEAKDLNKKTPILFTAVTDPVEASLIDSNENPGGYVTGTNDMNPIKERIELARELLPEATKLGILYTAAEENSQIQANIAKIEAEKLQFEVIIKTIDSINDIQQVAGQLAKQVDLIYIPTDNAIISSIGIVNEVSIQQKVPIVIAEENTVITIPAVTLSISYYNLGYETAQMAVQILKDGVKPKDIPAKGLTQNRLVVNKKLLESIGITVPESILNRADEVYE